MLKKIFLVLFFLSLPVGQVGGLMIKPGFVIYLHDVFLPLVILVSFLEKKENKLAKLKLSRPILLFIIAAFISLLINFAEFNTDVWLLSSLYLIRWILYAGIYFVVATSNISGKIWLIGLYGTGLAVTLLGYFQYLLYPTLRNLYYLGWDEHYYRLFSTFFDPNYVGAYLMLTFFCGIYLYEQSKRNKIFIFTEIFVLIAVLLTYSRGTFLSFYIGIIVWFLCIKRPIYIVLTGFFVIVLLFLIPTRGRDILKITRSESAIARVGNWYQSFRLFTEKPLFGFGFNTLRFVQINRGWASDSPFPSRSASGVDSSFLFVLVTTGTLGFLSYLNLLINKFKLGVKVLKTKKLLGIVYIVSLVATIIHSLFVNSLFYPWVMIWIWILVGVVERSSTSHI